MATFKAEIQKKRKDGTYSVKILLTHNRRLKRLPTGIYIIKDDMTRTGKIKNQEIIDQLDDIIRSYRNKANKLSVSINDMTIDKLADYLCSANIETIDFISVFQEYISENKDKKGIRNYKSALNSLISFIGRDTMDIAEITVSFLDKYAASLGNGRAPSLYLGCMRHVHAYAKLKYNDEDSNRILIPYSPFSRFKVPKQNVAEKRAIDAGLIRKIIDLPYGKELKNKNNRYNLAKDCFILSFALIGTNSVDLYNAETLKEGQLIYHRTKTKDRRRDKAKIVIDIQPHIYDLFQKYNDKTGARVFKFYQMYSDESTFNSALNKGLKIVGEKIGVKDLEFYAARHSWATIARNDLVTDKATINEALNHIDKSMSVTDLYITKNFTAINKVNKKVLDYIFYSDNKNETDKK